MQKVKHQYNFDGNIPSPMQTVEVNNKYVEECAMIASTSV